MSCAQCRYQAKAVDPSWEPGVRIALEFPKVINSCGLQGSYTYINSSDSSAVTTDDDVVPMIVHPDLPLEPDSDNGRGDWDATYHELELLMTMDCKRDDAHNFSPFIGVAALILDQRFVAQTSTGSNIDSKVDWNSDFWGIGLRAGTIYDCNISDNLTFHARVDVSILAGSACTSTTHDDSDNNSSIDFKFTNDEPCQIVPGFHIATALAYDFDMENYDLGIKVGYEFLQWQNIPNHRIFAGDNQGGTSATEYGAAISTSSNTRTFGFHGVTIGLFGTF